MDRFVDEFNPEASDVAVCGSMSNKLAMQEVIAELRDAGLVVSTPDFSETSDWSSFSDEQIIERKGWLIRRHLANIAKAKSVLVCNFDKNDTMGYVGSYSFLEMGVAFAQGKPLYLLNDVSGQANRDEILSLDPKVLKGNLERFVSEVKA